MLTFLSLALGTVVFGAHAVCPFRLARGPEEAQRRWSLLAPLLFCLAVSLALARYWRAVDSLATAEIGLGGSRELLGLAIFVALLAVFWGDLLLFFGRATLKTPGWYLAAAIGLTGLGAVSLGSEAILRGPLGELQTWPLFGAVLGRVLLGLACGELLAPGRPSLAPLGTLGLALHVLNLPHEVRSHLAQSEIPWPMAAAGILFFLAPWVPRRQRRWALLAAALLMTLAFSLLPSLVASLPMPETESLPVNTIFPR